jgi:hypothetical protein
VDKMIEVKYAGVVVGRSTIIRELDTRGLFLGVTEPMPVGTPVVLRVQDWEVGKEVMGKVEIVSESLDLPHAGMRIAFTDPDAAVLFGTPSEARPSPPEQPEPEAHSSAGAAGGAASLSPREIQAPPGPATDEAAAAGSAAAPAAHRRIVVDASTDKAQSAAASEVAAESAVESSSEDADRSTAVGGDSGRIVAPDPSAFGPGGGGKKGRRHRRR